MVRQLQMVAIRKDQRCYLVYALIARCVPFFARPSSLYLNLSAFSC